MKVVSVINHKGGVGKTTLTANLGAGLAARGQRVLLIDLDAQASLTVSFFTQSEWSRELLPGRTVKHWFDGADPQAAPGDAPKTLAELVATPPRVEPIVSSTGGRLDLIAAHRDLAEVDTGMSAELILDPARYLTVHSRLLVGLDEPAMAGYDVVLIDCAPNFGLIAKSAVAASDLLLIPTRPDYLSVNGIDSLGGRVTSFVEEYNAELAEAGGPAEPLARPPAEVVFTMVQFHDGVPIEAQQSYMSRVQALGLPTFDTFMRDSKSVYGPAPEYGVPVILAGTGRALTRELRELVTELSDRMEELDK